MLFLFLFLRGGFLVAGDVSRDVIGPSQKAHPFVMNERGNGAQREGHDANLGLPYPQRAPRRGLHVEVSPYGRSM